MGFLDELNTENSYFIWQIWIFWSQDNKIILRLSEETSDTAHRRTDQIEHPTLLLIRVEKIKLYDGS